MLRHGSLRDDRRRRSLLEDAAALTESGSPAKSRRTKSAEAYTDLARVEAHARWSDFVPLRNWALVAFCSAGLAIIAGLETAYFFVRQSSIWTDSGTGALDLGRPDSGAGWFAALVTFGGAVLAIFIYSVRRYRLDDYRGRYRVWLGAGVMCLVMSLDGIADLRSLVVSLGVHISQRVGPGDGIVWWLTPWSLFTAWIGLRMVLDARSCRTATTSLLLAFGGLTLALVLPYARLPFGDTEIAMIVTGCSLTGRWMLLFAHITFARHVLLDAHGQLPIRVPKPKREKAKPQTPVDQQKTAAKSATGKARDDLTTRIDPPHNASYRSATSGIDSGRASSTNSSPARPQTSSAKPALTSVGSTSTKAAAAPLKSTTKFISGDDTDEESRDSRKLSRAERKRLRKQQRDDRYGDE